MKSSKPEPLAANVDTNNGTRRFNLPKEVLVSKSFEEEIYYTLYPGPSVNDARVVRDGESFDIPFWSYVTKMEVSPIRTTAFHKSLWSNKFNDEDWYNRFVARSKPFTDEELSSLADMPKPKGRKMQRIQQEEPS